MLLEYREFADGLSGCANQRLPRWGAGKLVIFNGVEGNEAGS